MITIKKIQMNDFKMTFKDGFEEFKVYCITKNLSKDTIKHHENVIKTVFKFINPNMSIEDITRKTVNKFILDCKENLTIKDVTLNTYVRSLRTILYYFMNMGYIEKFNINAPKFDRQIIPTYSDEDLKKLLKKPNMKKCDFIEYRNYMICQFFMSVGCRTRTLINIKIKDLDFDNNVVYLNVTKNRKPLIIPLSNTLRKELKEYLRIRKGKEEDYLFCSMYGEQITRTRLFNSMQDYNRKREVNQSGLHRFRHTFAKKWILNGGSALKLKEILGHSNLEMVTNYVNMFTEDLQKDFDEFNPLEQFNKHTNMNLNMKRK
ncbi:tyrosine-type recombinase/integrase [Clostridium beijerinckii]|uniref:tyrosine-type recombinase/integrase n=1 Tax=Clostridium beijerinckii TaxID=1520 RepID=UPI004042E191